MHRESTVRNKRAGTPFRGEDHSRCRPPAHLHGRPAVPVDVCTHIRGGVVGEGSRRGCFREQATALEILRAGAKADVGGGRALRWVLGAPAWARTSGPL